MPHFSSLFDTATQNVTMQFSKVKIFNHCRYEIFPFFVIFDGFLRKQSKFTYLDHNLFQVKNDCLL